MPILSYDDVTGEARFVPQHFDDPREFVEIIRWQVRRAPRSEAGRSWQRSIGATAASRT